MYALELLLAAAEPAQLAEGGFKETLDAAVLEGIANVLKGLPLIGGLIALSTFIATWVNQVSRSFIGLFHLTCACTDGDFAVRRWPN
jgi:hypothetical protein